MSNVELNATTREHNGKAEVGRLRKTGQVPCVMYGVDKSTVLLSVDKLELSKLLSTSQSIIDVKYDGEVQGAVVREIQYHPVKGDILHVDFLRVKYGQEIRISVPVKFVGESEGVKAGGVFQEAKSELAIITLPRNLPEYIEVDITELDVNDTIHVGDLKAENFTIDEDPDDTVCSVVPPKMVEEPVEVEEGELEELEEEEEEATEPEVITSKKSEEEEE